MKPSTSDKRAVAEWAHKTARKLWDTGVTQDSFDAAVEDGRRSLRKVPVAALADRLGAALSTRMIVSAAERKDKP